MLLREWLRRDVGGWYEWIAVVLGMIRLGRYPVGYSNLSVDVLLIGGGRVIVFCHGGKEERCCGDETKRWVWGKFEAMTLGYLSFGKLL